ncbi:MAG: flagellar motor switch protein FliG [Acidobacteriota bacterium]|nr:flagellar motor switch protein FliG [Acidobacteriota bacterium]
MTTAVKEEKKLSGTRKAAVLMIALGDKAASNVMRCLSPADVQLVTEEIASVEFVSQEASERVLEEFGRLVATQEYIALGGVAYAERVLDSAFGSVEAKRLLDNALRSQSTKSLDLADLSRSDPQQLVKLIQDEQPQTVALILAHLGARIGSALLGLLPETSRGPVVEKLAHMGQLSGDTVQNVLAVVQARFQSMGRQHDRLAYGGMSAVAGILNRVDPTTSKAILESIEQSDPNLAVSIRDVLFTFEDMLTVPESSIRECLGPIDKKTLAVALKGASENLKAHIMKCMSSRAAEMLTEDMDALGPVRMREVQKAQAEIVNTLRALEAEGKISLRNEEADAFVV